MKRRMLVVALVVLFLVPGMLEAKFLWFGKGSPANEKAIFSVEGMTCEGCATSIRDGMSKIDGIVRTETFVDKKAVYVIYDKKKADASKVESAIDELGFEAQLVSVSPDNTKSASAKDKKNKGTCPMGLEDPSCAKTCAAAKK
ncbi:MAG: heavy-metal-associated domain-containing protein [Candidatus Eisenbacteria bacterium]|nr:heavy-metal-associated domain-containing protein [Candidatus Eisenbacteria bacterium]